MRGTGCSGGAFDFFEPLQSLDGYDVIETIAHQPWVLGHKVGMMGISYGAISQLFTAQLDPAGPRGDLAALDHRRHGDDALSRRHPQYRLRRRLGAAAPAGGRTGRAQQRTALGVQADPERRHDLPGQPGPPRRSGQPEREDRGQRLLQPRGRRPAGPGHFVNKIKVPVFMACQWEDEQTGGHCPELVQHFTGTTQKWFTFTNGAHIDSLDPYTFDRWYDFLELFVAHQAPIVNAAVIQAAAPVIYQAAMGLPTRTSSPCRPTRSRCSRRTARRSAAFEKLPEVRVLFDNGAGHVAHRDADAGRSVSRVRAGLLDASRPGHDRPHLVPRVRRGARRPPPTSEGINCVHLERQAPFRSPTTGTNTGTGGLWGNASQWQWNWEQNPAGTAVSYVSAPLTANTDGHRGRRRATSGCDHRPPTSTCRPRSAKCARTATRRSSRTAGSAPASASSPPSSNNMFKQPSTALEPIPTFTAADAAPMPSRAVRQGGHPALLRGPRVPRRLAHPGDDLRAERHAAGVVVRPDGAPRHGERSRSPSLRPCRRASSSRSFPA